MSEKQNVIIVSDEEHATILAALRFYQQSGMGDPMNRSDDIHEIAVNSDDDMTSLDDDGIDRLCERINFNTEPSEDMKQASKDIARRVNELGFLKGDKPMGLTQAMEVAAAVLGFRNRHAMKEIKPQANGKSSVPVKYWDCYHSEYQTAHTHQFDVDDQRKTNGQMYLDLGSLEGDVDDLLAVTMEVNTNPLNGIDHVPCAHVHFDGDNLAVSLFKIGSKILIRPETDVRIELFNARFNTNGPIETMYWIK